MSATAPDAAPGTPADATQQPAATPLQPQVRAPRRWWLLNLVLLLALAALGFLLQRQHSALEALAADAYAQQQRLAAAETAREQLAAQVQAALAAGDDTTTRNALTTVQRELATLRQELAGREHDMEPELAAREAASLLRLAQARATLGLDLQAGIGLYELAAGVLDNANSAALAPARAALRVELDALRAVRQPDRQGLYLQLGTVMQQVATLQLQGDDAAPLRFDAAATGTAAAAASWWDSIKQTLGQYFVVTRQDAPVLARLAPEQAFLIRQGIQLQLETARLALLQGEQRVYRSALETSAQGITTQLQGEAKAAVLASLQRLRAETITTDVPTLGAALDALARSESGAAVDASVTESAAGNP